MPRLAASHKAVGTRLPAEQRNGSEVMHRAAGASGVAAISSIVSAMDPREAATRLVAAVDEAWPTAPLHKRH